MPKIGLDFGTSYSFTSFLHGSQVQPLVQREEQYGIPSVYFRDSAGGEHFGRDAIQAARSRPLMLVTSIKQKMRLKEIDLGDGRAASPEEIMTSIAGYVLQVAETRLARDYPDETGDIEVVVAYPVEFGENQRAMIERAVANCTLTGGGHPKIISMIPEPVAAAIDYFGLMPAIGENILVCDLGGGTFDCALVQSVTEGNVPYKVIDQEGIQVGGDDWDAAFANWIKGKFEADGGTLSRRAEADLMPNARDSKIILSSSESTFHCITIGDDIWELKVTRDDFEACTRKQLEDVMSAVAKMKSRAKVAINQVILVGGGSKMPMFEKGIRKIFPDMGSRIRIYNPENSISYGAARYAASYEPKPLSLMSNDAEPSVDKMIELKSTHNYGIRYFKNAESEEKGVWILIRKGDTLPVKSTIESSTRNKGSFSKYDVFETTEEPDADGWVDPDKASMVISFEFDFGLEVEAGTKCVDTLVLNESNLLEIRVINPKTGKRHSEVKVVRKI
ncbi:MAG: Hsp70 family protein [Clostridiales bacterium]|nr:Hsp70 family protein [Clostridiales bacterium]MDR2749048.1 Hsp70 family protein [Clostridiales bacterium]